MTNNASRTDFLKSNRNGLKHLKITFLMKIAFDKLLYNKKIAMKC